MWFMTLDEPNLEQAGLVSVVVGAMAAVFGIYAGTSGQSKKFKGEEEWTKPSPWSGTLAFL